eukprot:CAMPEP_0115840220 /NCGR_PEP_ID=MMETSP0287-20121206/6658_1 /TAXON_ID=412157 /ORGANISM="Chrysochromulina rotalis, Strain UIO044" /LENGTH=44 /DNA_ID= /DNA_START= /DNA_END= /DNA_ORIENTATION=
MASSRAFSQSMDSSPVLEAFFAHLHTGAPRGTGGWPAGTAGVVP